MRPLHKGLLIGFGIGFCGLALFTASFMMNKKSVSTTQQIEEIADKEELQEEVATIIEETSKEEETEIIEEEIKEPPKDIILSFAGDVQFPDEYLSAYDASGISAIADQEMLTHMLESDLFILNEEFPYSLRGTPMPDKQFTFRTNPKYVSILKELGTDLVTLANNHALDFGLDAFCDSLETLKEAKIDYIGGGYNITEASAPAVYTLEGQTFAIFGATRVSPATSWYATDNQAGLFQTYDPTLLNAAIAEAEKTYDHTIVFVHWGIERNERPEEYQRNLAKGYIEAGADLIVGCHPHVLQGFEYYQGVPIVYSLGNYLFGKRTGETVLLKTIFSPEGDLRLQLIPCQRQNGVLSPIQEPSTLYQHLEELSFDVKIDEEGFLTKSN